MPLNNKDIWNKIRSGEIDINNREVYYSLLIKGFMYDLNSKIRMYDRNIPHIITNTGDDTMYLMFKGQDMAKEPNCEVTNADFIYNYIPRCNVVPKGITILTDQLTSPYSRGKCQIEHEGYLISYNSEFRRFPFKMAFDLTYRADTFTDLLVIAQQLIARMAFVNKYSFVYMGQEIEAAYTLPDSLESELMLEFDGITTDEKTKKFNISMEVESNLPIFCELTSIPSDAVILKTKENLTIEDGIPTLLTHTQSLD